MVKDGAYTARDKLPIRAKLSFCMWRVAGVGVDMLQLSRMAGLLQRQSPLRLARRILHPLEQDQLMAEFGQSSAADAAALSVPLALHPESDGAVSQWQLRLVRYLGTRWAIKEAAFKAMYPKVRLDWHQAVITKQQGKPTLRLMDLPNIECQTSVSHDAGLVIAMVVIEERRPTA